MEKIKSCSQLITTVGNISFGSVFLYMYIAELIKLDELLLGESSFKVCIGFAESPCQKLLFYDVPYNMAIENKLYCFLAISTLIQFRNSEL